MSKGLRTYPVEERPKVVERRLAMISKQGKDWKPGLGTLAAFDFVATIKRKQQAQESAKNK